MGNVVTLELPVSIPFTGRGRARAVADISSATVATIVAAISAGFSTKVQNSALSETGVYDKRNEASKVTRSNEIAARLVQFGWEDANAIDVHLLSAIRAETGDATMTKRTAGKAFLRVLPGDSGQGACRSAGRTGSCRHRHEPDRDACGNPCAAGGNRLGCFIGWGGGSIPRPFPLI